MHLYNCLYCFFLLINLVTKNEELQLKVEELDNENYNLNSRVDQQDASIVELTDKLHAVARSDDETRDKLDRAENKVASMKAKERDFETLTREIDAYRTEIYGKDAEIKRLKEQLETQKEQLTNMALQSGSTGGGKKKRSGWSCVP